MHRTVKGTYLFYRSAEVNGTKAKSLRTSPEMPHRRQKSRARKQSLLGSQFVYIGVLSDDFAAVDVREELCYHSRPKKQIQEVHGTGIKPMKESHARRKKRQPIPKAVQRGRLRSAAPFVAVNFAFRRLAFTTRPVCSVTSPLPKKSLLCKSFSGALFYSVFLSFLCLLFCGVCLAAAPEREARRFVVRRQPHHNA